MIITCTECQKKLRIDARKYAGKALKISCPQCHSRISFQAPPLAKVLVAHGEPEVCRSILEVCRQDLGEILTCSDATMVRKLLSRHNFSVLLLDVALPGAFPFQLIEEIHADELPLKIILLPSVYNRTAYKRKPSSLYGADAYLELHHLSDRLVPLLHDLVPDLGFKSQPFCQTDEDSAERALSLDAEVPQQAAELARMLVADIALYHQELIDDGIRQGDLPTRLADKLDEGRRMLAMRIPKADLDKQDYLLEALMFFARARELELNAEGGDSHG